jgi:putative hydroxymethylpyrimidine transport system substrate-binding protein
MRRIAAAVLTVAVLGSIAACGEKKEVLAPHSTHAFTVMLDFFPNADHTGIYAAMANGDFARAGLDVRPRTPSDPSAPLKLLAAGQADMAISYEPELLLARDRGLKLVSVGALVQRPLTSFISLPNKHISSVAQLAGHRVGTAGIPYQSAELQTALAAAGVPAGRVQEINVGFNLVPAMLSGKVDATLGGFWNYEGIQLTLAKRNPTVIPVDQAGVPTYSELVLVVREDEAQHRGAEIRAFLQALTRGEESVRANPSHAVAALVKANPDLDPRLQLASVQRSLSAFFPANPSLPFGYQDARTWDAFGSWMYSHHLVTQPPYAAKALTNEFLPGQGI